MRGSEWSVWLFIYQGAFVIIRKSFDCYRCITDVFDLLAQPQSMMPYVHMGFSTVLYIISLFSSERGKFFPISQFISLVLRSSCFFFLVMCSLHVNLLSRCSPRYFTVEPWGMVVWLMLIDGHCSLEDEDTTYPRPFRMSPTPQGATPIRTIILKSNVVLIILIWVFFCLEFPK